MAKYQARIGYLLDIEADNIRLATKLAKGSVPTHTSATIGGIKGVCLVKYGGGAAVKIEAVKEEGK